MVVQPVKAGFIVGQNMAVASQLPYRDGLERPASFLSAASWGLQIGAEALIW